MSPSEVDSQQAEVSREMDEAKRAAEQAELAKQRAQHMSDDGSGPLQRIVISSQSVPTSYTATAPWPTPVTSPQNPDAKYPAIGVDPNEVGPNNFTDFLLENGSYL